MFGCRVGCRVTVGHGVGISGRRGVECSNRSSVDCSGGRRDVLGGEKNYEQCRNGHHLGGCRVGRGVTVGYGVGKGGGCGVECCNRRGVKCSGGIRVKCCDRCVNVCGGGKKRSRCKS